MPRPRRRGPALSAAGRWAMWGVAVGILAGLGAVAFHHGLQFVSEQALEEPAGYRPPEPAGEIDPDLPPAAGEVVPWLLVLIPAVGGLLAGLLIHGFCPQAEGEGTDGMIRAFHRQRGVVSLRVLWVKLVASVLTIGSGGSAGREGPSTQIGGAIGSLVARLAKLSERDRRVLLLAGASAGVGAIFRAPLGGALFAGEVLYRDTDSENEALIPCLVASIVAYAVFLGVLGTGSMFQLPDCSFERPVELVYYAGLGALCAGVGLLYVRALRALHVAFHRLRLWAPLRPALGGASVGCLALLVGAATGDVHSNVLGGGHGLIQSVLDSKLVVVAALVLLVGKVVATGCTVGSGGSGGLFAPSLVIGALLGSAVGESLHAAGLVQQPASFVLVGMGGFFAGVGKVPITAVVMVSEITKSYELLAPLMLAASISFLLSRRFTLFEQQVPSRLESPAHAGDFVVDVLEELRVQDVMDGKMSAPTLIEADTPLQRVLLQVAQSDSRYFPVVDGEGRMLGIFSLTDVRRVMTETELANLVLAREIATEDVLTVTPSDDLNTAMRRFTMKNIDELPVVDPDDGRRVLGMLSRKDVIGAYGRRVQELKEVEA